MSDFYVGKRLSYDGNLCTVQYIGDVSNTKGKWLGVEWDDPSRGKHSGQHNGVHYFACKSGHSTAGSFIRPNRPSDLPNEVNGAIQKKYASSPYSSDQSVAIHINGKEVEEVGFEKIRRQLADFKSLHIVLVDQQCIAFNASISELCPNIQELDLSRNLFENVKTVFEIVGQLPQVSSLRIDGNRFRSISKPISLPSVWQVGSLSFLSLDDTLLEWTEIALVASYFPALTSLSAGGNQLRAVDQDLALSNIAEIRLERNDFTSLENIRTLFTLPSLRRVALKQNAIGDLLIKPQPNSIVDFDLSQNRIASWATIDRLGETFPFMTTLRVSQNPLYNEAPEDVDYLETVARLPNITTLNYSQITPKDRRSAETFYLSKVGSELSAVTASDEMSVIRRHPRYKELCATYGDPVIKRANSSSIHPESLEAGLVRCILQLDVNMTDSVAGGCNIAEKDLPRRFNITSLLGIIGKTFKIDNPGLLELKFGDKILKPATRPLGMFVEGESAHILVRWDENRVKQCRQAEDRMKSRTLVVQD